mmetsp:Transcript_5985/g.17626  ORF Transcript_5985/g.17626 Transcript_5985/m.17626 type:complete len:245 (-) Transcript_5985:1921-2655(-)
MPPSVLSPGSTPMLVNDEFVIFLFSSASFSPIADSSPDCLSPLCPSTISSPSPFSSSARWKSASSPLLTIAGGSDPESSRSRSVARLEATSMTLLMPSSNEGECRPKPPKKRDAKFDPVRRGALPLLSTSLISSFSCSFESTSTGYSYSSNPKIASLDNTDSCSTLSESLSSLNLSNPNPIHLLSSRAATPTSSSCTSSSLFPYTSSASNNRLRPLVIPYEFLLFLLPLPILLLFLFSCLLFGY